MKVGSVAEPRVVPSRRRRCGVSLPQGVAMPLELRANLLREGDSAQGLPKPREDCAPLQTQKQQRWLGWRE